MTEPELLRRAGEALYGGRWQSPLARDLAVAVRTVQRWAAGDTPIPPGVRTELRHLLDSRAGAIADLRRSLGTSASVPDRL